MMRKVTVIFTLVSLIILGLAAGYRATASPTVQAVGNSPAADMPTLPFGVDMRGTIDESQGLSQAVNAGAQWIRIKVSWEQIEPIRTVPPTYNWSYYDTIFSNASSAGMNLVVTIRDNPTWAAQTRCGPLNDPNDLARFAQALVARYSQPPYSLKVWELYNEPDNWRTNDWFINLGGCWGNAPEAYANMLKVVYPAIKAADPEAIVLIGALGFEDRYVDHLKMDFLDRVLSAGGGAYFDRMNFHYFHEYHANWDNYTTKRYDVQGKLDALRAILSSHGISKPFVITELGHPYFGPPEERYTPKKNSQYVIQGHVRAIADDVELIIWYQMVDGPEDPRLYGLLNAQLEPQLGYYTYARLIQELAGAHSPSRYQAAVYGLEAYQFSKEGHSLIIAWCQHDGVVPITVPWKEVRLVDRRCDETTCDPYQDTFVADGGPGDEDKSTNGQITFILDADPVFIEEFVQASPTPTPSPSATPSPTPTGTATPSPTPTGTATLTPSPTPTPSPTATQMPAGSLPFYGIQLRDVPSQFDLLPQARDAGMQTVRFNLRWAEVEPVNTDPPTYEWEDYDALVRAAADAGLAIVLTVRDNPSWAASTACGPIDRVPLSRFADFLRAAVARYSAPPYNVKFWELYNEPDNKRLDMPQQGGCWGNYPTEYAGLLNAAYPAIKAADPHSQLVFGGLALEEIDGTYFNVYFLNQVLAAPGGHQFDVMNFHYYRAFHWRWDPFGADLIGKTAYVRGVLAQAGLDKPIILTEVGYPSAGPPEDGQDYSDVMSSRYVAQALTRAHAADLRSVVWFEMMDDPNDPRKYGLLGADGTPKPAYSAFQTLTDEIGAAAFLRDESDAGMERYVFDAGGGRTIYVLWSTDAITDTYTLAGRGLWITDKLGNRRGIRDGAPEDKDGIVNGLVAFDVGADPQYVSPMLAGELPAPALYLPLILRAGP